MEYEEWLLTNVLKDVSHRQWVFSIPKRLRIYSPVLRLLFEQIQGNEEKGRDRW
ncbi:hypothetical protein [uncultured Desulfobacter sp.]|uniref:hypothetical protein n=1 Tax=uncultured Desulfobacter sp. TaxID=240139 RepID=UPI0029F4D383|nr:hypothetical protein [uncultured Desulfobacter sp.]